MIYGVRLKLTVVVMHTGEPCGNEGVEARFKSAGSTPARPYRVVTHLSCVVLTACLRIINVQWILRSLRSRSRKLRHLKSANSSPATTQRNYRSSADVSLFDEDVRAW